MTFQSLRLTEPILRALANEGYLTPTPIQAQAIPHVLEGRDVLGCAQTGTGKTAVFALPILQRLADRKHAHGVRPIRALVLSPTRELAAQIGESFRVYGKHTGVRYAEIFGGVNQNPQVRLLKQGVDVVIATPGRLLDLVNQGFVKLNSVQVLVLDEADRMLDMGFIHDIKRLVSHLPAQRQTLMFSATMPNEIRRLANAILRQPVSVEVAPVAATAEKIEQQVHFVPSRNKPALLEHMLQNTPMVRTLVFTRTKHGADRVVRGLHRAGIHAEAIHGNKTQSARQRALANFRSEKTPVLVATDIAARGIDVDNISHVVNFDLPHEPETYVHRIGRTGRAGASGIAISFCDPHERDYLKAIERLTKRTLAVIEVTVDYPKHDARHPHPAAAKPHATNRHSTAPQPRTDGRGHAPRGRWKNRGSRQQHTGRGANAR